MTMAALLCSAVISLGMPRAEYACRYMDLVVKEAQSNDIEPEILVALIHRESRWKPWAESHAGACGLTQVMPKYTKPKKTCSTLKKPRISIGVGARTLSYWVYEFGGGDYKTGLCGYNGGYVCKKYSASKAYARSIMRFAGRINEQMMVRRSYNDLMENLHIDVTPPAASPVK